MGHDAFMDWMKDGKYLKPADTELTITIKLQTCVLEKLDEWMAARLKTKKFQDLNITHLTRNDGIRMILVDKLLFDSKQHV